MNRLRKLIVGIFLLGLAWPARADIVYPARLELTETAPGVFEVRFVLPVFQGKVLKAVPVLPDLCENLTDPERYGDANSVVTRWRVVCPAERLPGQTIGIEGLLGSPVDIHLQISLLSGRIYRATLSPAAAFYQVPLPPGIGELLRGGLWDGMRFLLRRGELYLLVFLFLFLGPSYRRSLAAAMGIVFGITFAAGQWLAAQQWLILDPILPVWAVLGVGSWVAWRAYAGAASRAFSPLGAVLFGAGLLGMMYGGVFPASEAASAFTPGERAWYLLALTAGVGIGLFLVLFLCREALALLRLVFPAARGRLSFGLAVLSMGSLFYALSALAILPNPIGPAPFLVLGLPVLAGFWLGRYRDWPTAWLVTGAVIFAGLGLILGFGLDLPAWAPAWVSLTCLVLLARLGWEVDWPNGVEPLLLVPALVFAGWDLGAFSEENVSFAEGHAVGMLLVLLTVGWFAHAVGRGTRRAGRSVSWRGLCLLLGLAVMATYFRDYLEGAYQAAIAALSVGRLTLPLLSGLLVLLALRAWPRRRAIHRAMAMEGRKPTASVFLLALALVSVPFGTVEVADPRYEPHPPDAREASRLLRQVLWQTYTAFNEEDEDVLYDKLNESVAPELIDNLYLDSRRRLRSGVREGAEVSVREVAIDSVGADIDGVRASEGFTFPTDWVVTARVKHLQHVHHRRNLYAGRIQLRLIDGQWKIARIMLDSEERVIVPASSG